MYKNIILNTLRLIKKNLFFSGINILGLSVGIACSLLIWLWVQNELSYDNFHKKGDRIYRLIQDMDFEKPVSWAINQGPLGPALVQDFPELEQFTRYMFSNRILETGSTKFREPGAYIDPGFFDIFSIDLIEKIGNEIFPDNRSILLSEKLAKKYYPKENAIGQSLRLSDEYTFIVSGIFEDVPKNSHLYFDYLLPMEYGKEIGFSVDRWNNSQFYTYVLASVGTTQETINAKIKNYLEEKPTLEENTILRVQKLKDIYLKSDNDFDFVSGDLRLVQIFFIIAIFLLLIACINFMNLSTARATRRAKEMGIRKVIGAKRSTLVNHNLFETFIQILISLIISIILIKIAQPGFNQIANKELTLNLLDPQIYLGLVLVLIICTSISGIYPAIILSLFNPSTTIKGNVKGGRNALFTKSLVIFQFFISVIMIICTIVIHKQISYMNNKELGYNNENVVLFRIPEAFKNKFETVRSELLQSPYIQEIAGVNAAPDQGYTYSNTLWSWDEMQTDKSILFRHNRVGDGFFRLFEIDITEGRSFLPDSPTDSLRSVILNESAVKAMGLKNPVGSRMKYNNNDFYHEIIGVAKDFNYGSLKNKIEPMVILYSKADNYLCCAKINGEHATEALNVLENKWKEFEPNNAFEYQFMDQRFQNLFTSEKSVFRLVIIFAIIAILISCLGLFGLTSFVVERRNKEIGIRKVYGANISNINNQLINYFLKWMVIANLLAWPIAWLIMSRWLDNYAYHTKLNYWIFVLALAISLFIAFSTIVTQSTRAALKNPVDILRYE